MTKAQRSARRFRRVILVLGIVYTLAAIGWLVLPHFESLFDGFRGAGLLGSPMVPGDVGEFGYSFCPIGHFYDRAEFRPLRSPPKDALSNRP